MKNPVTKSMLRSPLKTILKLGIISLALYFFISSAVKLYVVNTEIEKIGSFYTSIGQLEGVDTSSGGKLFDVKPEVKNLIKESPYVDIENILWRIQGISDNLYNRDFGVIDHYPQDLGEIFFSPDDNVNLGDMIFIGKLEDISKIKNSFDGSEGLRMTTTIGKVISGYPEYGMEGDTKSITAVSSSPIINRPHPYITPAVIDEMKELKKDSYYLFRGYNNYLGKDPAKETNIGLSLKPLYEGGPLYYPVENLDDFNLEAELWGKLREDIEIIDQNRHTFTLRPTKDMSKLPNMQEITRAYFLTEGRWIDINDHKNENKVCVIRSDLANQRNLKLGDKISLKQRYIGSVTNYIFTEENKKTWRDKKISDEIEYEVVGIFTHLYNDNMNFDKDDIYVPESTVLIDLKEIEKNPSTSAYSFVLRSSKDEAKFLDENSEKIRNLGYEIKFVDSNAKEFWNNAEAMKVGSLNNTMVFGLLLLIAMIFTLFLHFQDFKRVYAIERTLGIPVSTARKHIINPILILISTITLVIIIISRYDSVKQVEKQMSGLVTNLELETAINVSSLILLAIFLGIMFVFSVFLLLFIKRLERKSIIELIQMGKAQKRKKTIDSDAESDTHEKIDIREIDDIPSSRDLDYAFNSKNKSVTLNKFTRKQIMRSKLQTTLLILLSLIFVFSILWLNQLMTMNKWQIDSAYKNIEIDADFYRVSDIMTDTGFSGDISERILDDLESTNLISEINKVGTAKYNKMEIYRNGKEIVNEKDEDDQSEIYTVYYSGNLVDNNGNINLEDVQLKENIDPKLFTTKWNVIGQEGEIHKLENENGETEIPVLASNSALAKYGLETGDEISFSVSKRKINRVYGKIVGQFERDKLEVLKDGSVMGANRGEFFVMPIEVMKYIEKNNLYYEKAKIIFDKEKNKELYERSNEIKEMVKDHRDNKTSLGIKIWDEELQKVVGPLEKNLSLLEIVYPITLIISLLTAGFIAYIINLRKAKDMAMLRVLGVSNKEVKAQSIKESLILTLIGVTIGVILMLVFRKSEYEIGTTGYILAAGSYIMGSVLGLMLALKTRDSKKPLELLQVKE